MPHKSLDMFGSFLMKEVRDRSIRHWDSIVGGSMKDETSRQLHNVIMTLSPEARKVIASVIPRIVDTSLHAFLQSIEDNDQLDVCVITEVGQIDNLCDLSDGLAGELYSDQGWLARFSNERIG